MKFFITGGAGFIGSALVRYLIQKTDHQVLCYDLLTYAGNLDNLLEVKDHPRFQFVQGDILDFKKVRDCLAQFKPDKILHLAAESHVDRSIEGPMVFVQTNVVGTVTLLQAALDYFQHDPHLNRQHFLFHHISTDEVYGELGDTGFFTEQTAYDPSSPYSASKAASDHFVRAYGRTYKLPIIVTNCSNNYGPYHFPEKLIPLVITKALKEEALPIYGKGENVRDWLYVEDHARALVTVATQGIVGETYNIGGESELKNIEVVQKICRLLDELRPRHQNKKYEELITFVTDRAGHDFRYAIDCTKIKTELGWKPTHNFDSGLRATVQWFLDKNESPA